MPSLKRVGLTASFRWLARGWRDLWTVPAPCLLYGAAVAAASFFIWRSLISSDLAFWALALSCGFVFIAPMLAMGLYEAGRAISRGQRPTLGQIFYVRSAVRPDVFYLGLALLFIFLLWGRIAQLVYGLSTYQVHRTVEAFLSFALDTPEGHAMLIGGTIVGGVLALFTFAITVVSAPMLLDRSANVFGAIFTSLQAMANNFWPLLLWAALIALLLIACAATGWLGLVLVFPWLGLASWRAYEDLVPMT